MRDKIIYESEIQLSNAMNISCHKIEVLREAVKKETNQIVIDALHMAIKTERNPVDNFTRNIIKH